MKKDILVTSLSATVFFLLLMLSFSMISVSGAPTNVTFTVNLTLGNDVPNITFVESGVSANPTESAAATVNILFNATDNNGHLDLNYSSARIILTQSGEQQRASTSCVNYQNSTLVKAFNCTIAMQYYDRDGNWQINATVQDSSSQRAENTSFNFSYGQLQAVRTSITGLTFSSVSLGQVIGASNDPLIMNNTGNQNFTVFNITAYALIGDTTPSEYIPASNITINATSDALGQQLVNNTPVTITNAVLARDVSGIDTNESLYLWVDVPDSGLSNQNYLSSSSWIIEVFP